MKNALVDALKTFLGKVAATDKDTANEVLSLKTREAVTRYLLIVWANQTADEQQVGATNHRNGLGFNGADGSNPALLSMCKWAEERGTLSGKQARYVASKLGRYAAQIAATAPTPGTAAPVSETPALSPSERVQSEAAYQKAAEAEKPAPAPRKRRKTRAGIHSVDMFGREVFTARAAGTKGAAPRVNANGDTASEAAFVLAVQAWDKENPEAAQRVANHLAAVAG